MRWRRGESAAAGTLLGRRGRLVRRDGWLPAGWPQCRAGPEADGYQHPAAHHHEELRVQVQQPGCVRAEGGQVEQAGQGECHPGEGRLVVRLAVGAGDGEHHPRALGGQGEAHDRARLPDERASGHDGRRAAEQGPAERAETPPAAAGGQHREHPGRAGQLERGQPQGRVRRMLGRLGHEQDAVLDRPDQPGRRIGVARPPPGVPQVGEVAGQAGQPRHQAPRRW